MGLSTILGLFVRHALTTAGGGLVASGVVGADDVQTAAGAVATVVGVVWSVFQKRSPTLRDLG